MSIRGLAFLGAFLAAAGAWAQDERAGVRIREWFPKLEGDLQAQGKSIPSTDIDVDSTLGMDDTEPAHEIQLYLGVPVLGRFYAGTWWVTFEGDRTLDPSESFTFADTTFSASTRVKTELDLEMYYLSYELVLASPSLGETAKAEVGLLIGARILQAEASLENEFVNADDEGTGGLPVGGVHAAVQFTPWLRADVEVMGFAVSYSGTSARYFEGYGELVALPWKGFFGGVGYKVASVDLKDESGFADFQIDLRIDGFYVTAGVRF